MDLNSAMKNLLPDYLWGIETVPGTLALAGQKSFQTTYEELKLRISRNLESTRSASRLPMRNWNTVCSKPVPISLSSFQTTYEELKLVWNHTAVFKCAWLPDYLWGIETFYPKHTVLRLSLASRLPMRNWNASTLWPHPHRLSLPDYLWGIETRGSSDCRRVQD